MKKFKAAVIGKDVSKSQSPEMHTFISTKLGYEIDYEKLSIPEEDFSKVAEKLFSKYDGFNVTIPYKMKITDFLEREEGDAKVFGAVNTVLSKEKKGYNTDGLGFMLMLENGGVKASNKEVLVLGAGGAGRSVAKKLIDGGANVSVFDMRAENVNSLKREFGKITALESVKPAKYYLIINATGVGMHKTEGISPVGGDILGMCEVAVDLIYTPEKSRFLEIAEGLGKKIINGRAMLFYQAYYSECIYFGVKPDEKQAKRLFEKFTVGDK